MTAKPWYKKIPWWGWTIVGAFLVASVITAAVRGPSADVAEPPAETPEAAETPEDEWPTEDAQAFVDEVSAALPQAYGASTIEEMRATNPDIPVSYIEAIDSPAPGEIRATLAAGAPNTDPANLTYYARGALGMVGTSLDSIETLTLITATGDEATAKRGDVRILGGTPTTAPNGLSYDSAFNLCADRTAAELPTGEKFSTTAYNDMLDGWQGKYSVRVGDTTFTVECTVTGSEGSATVTEFTAY